MSKWTILPRIILVSAVLQISFYYNNLYDLKATRRSISLTYNLIHSFAVSAMILGGLYLLFPGLIIERGVFFLSIAFVVLFVFPWRYLYVSILRRKGLSENVLVVGTGSLANQIGKEVFQRASSGYNLVGFLTNDGPTPMTPMSVPVFSGLDQELFQRMKDSLVNTVVVASNGRCEGRNSEDFLKEISERFPQVQIKGGSEYYEEVAGKLFLPALTVADAQQLSKRNATKVVWHLKRLIDILISLIGLLVTLPISLISAVAIKVTSRGPALFSQERVGQNKKPFKLLKFRSMRDNAEADCGPVWADIDDERVTSVGRIIRKFRIDEIPQMWNVLRGQMSFVGPRPERPCFVDQLEKDIPFYSYRHSVKPGITGLAQVRHYYTSSTEETIGKLEYDLYYVKRMSPLLDLIVCVDTVKTVMFGAGAR